MISFIIISKNQALFLNKCLKSIFLFIKKDFKNYEVIYVDSNSIDENIKVASKYQNIKILKLESDINAAIARNTGASHSKGDFLIFLDGDTILNQDFAIKYLNKSFLNSNEFISGDLINYFHDNNYEFLYSEPYWRERLKHDRYENTTGGNFCISKRIWNKLNGMKVYYRRNQDNDFGFRVYKKFNLKLLRIKDIFLIHQTISYTSKFRLFKILFAGDFLFRGVLIREHLFMVNQLKNLIRIDYSFISLLISFFIFFITYNLSSFFIFLGVVFLRSIFSYFNYNENFLLYFIYILFRDIQIFFGFLFYYPSKKKNIKFKKIR